MYTMKQACEATGLSYETLKYYCKQGLVPNVKRDAANRRCFDDRDIRWIRDLVCLRNCGMGIDDMKRRIAQWQASGLCTAASAAAATAAVTAPDSGESTRPPADDAFELCPEKSPRYVAKA